jgi:hypothetical protein
MTGWSIGGSHLLTDNGNQYRVGPSSFFIRPATEGAGEDHGYSQGETDDTVYISDEEHDVVEECGDSTDTVYFDKDLDQVDQSTCENRISR